MKGLLEMAVCLASVVAAGGCGSEAGSGPAEVGVGPLLQVVPGDSLPAEVVPQTSNNNLDVVRHEGRIYLAFRTAPSHFASKKTVLYVVSAAEVGEPWRYETQVAMQTDLREPRFLSWRGRLWLYFAVLGDSPFDFEPRGAQVTERAVDGAWSEPKPFYEPAFIPWRFVVRDDRPYLIGYTEGGSIYDDDPTPVSIHWLTTEDGESWGPAAGDDPIVLRGGGSETGFSFTDDGALIAVVRNEMGDEDGWGSKVCRAEPDALHAWRCTADPRKYDSPLVFNHRGGIWLIGRRHLTETGHFDVSTEGKSHTDRLMENQIAYWDKPKRCSLWQVEPEALTVTLQADLPSRGDTCFASVLPMGDHEYDVYNYTSPVDGPDVGWQEGQTGPTLIYRARLTLPAP